MFSPLASKTFAEEVKFLLEKMTGDRTKIIGLGQQGNRWIIQRWNGSEWVEG